MRKLKLGFTLAEILSALAIVGVVSAMVLPMTVKNVQQNQSGPILGRVIEQIQLGSQNMIQFANSNSVDGSFTDVLSTITESDLGVSLSNRSIFGRFANIVPVYWGLNPEPVELDNNFQVQTFAGANDANTANIVREDGTNYSFKNIPADISIIGAGAQNSVELDARTGIRIYVDTNGLNNRPNRVGVDIYALDLLNNGRLVPATGIVAGQRAERVIRDGFRNTMN